MSAKLANPVDFDESFMARLACPACHGDLRLEDARLVCTFCHRAYPVVDGIPALIAERAEAIEMGEVQRRPTSPADT